MICLMPKVKVKVQSNYGKHWRGAIFQKHNHCNPILKPKFIFLLVSSFQVSLGKGNIHVTYQMFLLYMVEMGKFSSVYFKSKLTGRREFVGVLSTWLNWCIHQLWQNKFRKRALRSEDQFAHNFWSASIKIIITDIKTFSLICLAA